MGESELTQLEVVIERIRRQAKTENLRLTQHAQQEMTEEGIGLDEVIEALKAGQILENYPQHRRGACCLVNGLTGEMRPLHVVCTTAQPTLIIITVYEPKPPTWITPTKRRRES